MSRVLAAACLTLVLPAAAGAQSLLLSPADLAARLTDPRLVLLHVGEKAGYDVAHIPGARFADVRNALHTREDGLNLQMLAPELLRDRLAALGISDNSRIVVYFGSGWLTPATRLVLTLQWAGLKDVAFLDGGIDAWTRDGRAVTADVPAVTPGSLSPLKVQPIIASAEFVQAQVTAPKAGVAIVDARTTPFYDGTQVGGTQAAPHKAGHIAGALSIPYTSLFTDDGRAKPEAELRSIFAAAGVKPGDTVVTYCHIGQQATAVAFAARLLGHKVMLYDGSFEDWSRRK